jgi:hypothetical protein
VVWGLIVSLTVSERGQFKENSTTLN